MPAQNERATALPNPQPQPQLNPNPKHLNLHTITTMADFFNVKARQQAAAMASSSKAPTTKQEPNRMQPWVEK